MINVFFKKIIIKNFLSFGSTPTTINFSPGIHLITGENLDKIDSKNGVGKTSIIDAILFVLFDKTTRDVNKKELVNNTYKRDCEVDIYFDIVENNIKKEYIIARGISPTKLNIQENSKDITLSNAQENNEFICKLIGSSYTFFINSLLMSINSTNPFMSLKKVDKRKFIEDIFNLSIFNDVFLDIRKDFNDTKNNLDVEFAKKEEIEKSISLYNSRLGLQNESLDQKIIDITNKLKENNDNINNLKTKIIELDIDNQKKLIEKINEYIKKINFAEEKINTVNINIKLFEKIIKDIKNDINKLENFDNIICKECKRPITDKDKEFFKNKINEFNNEINKNNNIINNNIKIKTKISKIINMLNNKKNEIQEELDKINQAIQDNKFIEFKIKELNEKNISFNKDLEYLKNEKLIIKKVIDEFNEKIKYQNNIIEEIKNKLTIIDIAKNVTSEDGVKAFIIKRMINFFNNILYIFLKKFESNCRCTFNEFFEEKMTNERGIEYSYDSFSSGEKKRIDLACLFTFMEINKLRGNAFYNFSFFDELFDSSLDSRGIELIMEYLKERVEKNKECIYIITHKKDISNQYINNIIMLQKKNNITKIIQ